MFSICLTKRVSSRTQQNSPFSLRLPVAYVWQYTSIHRRLSWFHADRVTSPKVALHCHTSLSHRLDSRSARVDWFDVVEKRLSRVEVRRSSCRCSLSIVSGNHCSIRVTIDTERVRWFSVDASRVVSEGLEERLVAPTAASDASMVNENEYSTPPR